MRQKLFEFYDPKDEEIENAWLNGIISFDANVLLNFYRYSSSTNKEFFRVLDKVNDRVWIPYQVAFEFHSNSLNTIQDQFNAYSEIKELIKEYETKLCSDLNKYKKHSLIQIEILKEEIILAFNDIVIKLNELQKNHPNYDKVNPIIDKVSNLFEGKVGNNYSDEELDKIFKDAEGRYDKKIPPGYMDKIKKKNESKIRLYGDVLVWLQIIDYSKQYNKDIIFITDELKEDWWDISNGKKISPRKELIKEFHNKTGIGSIA